ncbi:kelch repeat-containing protein [Sorangium sp. So ce315]|uniref:kelch repeat-containing protein n=1 Tax=Sorangium sp. So ce315 TaxID=3133299 RepID=UPI003F61C122
MSPCGFLRRVLPRFTQLLWAAACHFGCSAEPEWPASAAALRRQFPDQSAAVLEAREAFFGDADGFHLASAEVNGRPSRPHVVLPREGSEPIRFRTPAGIEVRVRELGAAGEGIPVERAVAYRRSGGTSFWSATERGVEEWLLLDEGIARGGEVVAAWQVEGATLRARGEAVEVVEQEKGAAVLRVSAPRAHAPSGRPVAMALTARGSRIELSVDAGGEAVLVDPVWELTHGAMNVARMAHTETLLPSGLVLVAGGWHDHPLQERVVTFDSAELYDPAADSWSLTGSMEHARSGHTATLLSSGEVLVVGGLLQNYQEANVRLETAELYQPETGTWTTAAPMRRARDGHTATLLPSGKVLVAGGGEDSVYPDSVELYDPEDDRWEFVAPMRQSRAGHGAALLSSGKVLVVGGRHIPGSIATAELYDPEDDRWEFVAPMEHARARPTVTLLPNGDVLVAGGVHRDGTRIASAERYEPEADSWTLTSPMNRARAEHTASLLPDGMVLFAGGIADGGFYLSSAERYDPAGDSWAFTSAMSSPRGGHTATRLLSGEVLVAGGRYSDHVLAETERFGLARGEACTAGTACLSPDVCVDGTCCDVPCPCGTCGALGTEGRCGEAGSPAKAGMICAPARCDDGGLLTYEAALCTPESSACPAQVSAACVAYRCDPQSGACRQSCASIDDCVPGFVCNLRGHCVPAPPAPDAAPGCSAGPGRAAPVAACAAGVLLALGVARRRRRRAAGALVTLVALAAAFGAEATALAQPAAAPAWPAPPPASPPAAAPPSDAAAPPSDAAAPPSDAAAPPSDAAAPPSDAAAPPSAANPVAEARAHFERGLDLYRQGAWEPALAEFLASRQHYPTWSATSSAALCLQRLRRYDEALALFETLLGDFAQRLPPETRSAAQQAVVRMRGLVGTVDVADAEIGASIMIDGQHRGDYPLPAPLRVGAGSHVIRVYKDGFEPFETRVDVAGGQVVRILSRLQKLVESGRLRVTEQNGKALDVLVDGYTVGKTPWEGPLSPGQHTVVLRGSGDLGTMPASVVIRLKQTTPLALHAEELSATLRIEPTPVCASVTVDGVALGSGIWEGRLSPGRHRIEVAAGGFVTARREAVLARGARAVVPVALERMELGRSPGRFLVELDVGPAFLPSFGGAAPVQCRGSCSLGLGAGGLGAIHAGYELWSGFGFGVTTGYLQVHQTVTARRVSLEIQDRLPDSSGEADDALVLSGFLAGGWAGLSLGDRHRFSFRLGAGALLGTVRDERTGTFFSSSGVEFHLDPTVAQDPARFFVMTPEVRGGLRLGEHLEVAAGLAAAVLVRLREPVWTNPPEGAYGRIDPGSGYFARFEQESLAGTVMLAIAPKIGMRYTF